MKAKIRTILFWFILLQPFLDLYWFFNGKLANLLPFTLPTIIRILAVAVIFCLFFSQKQNWQKLGKDKWLIAYLVILVVYSLLHLWHVRNFVSVNPNDYNYSTSGELFYLLRMFLPLSIIFFTEQVDFLKKDFKLVIEILSGLFSFTIVLSNLFIVSLRSYGTGTSTIRANIFGWFFNQHIGYSYMASKGFFNFSNMISAVLFALVPLMVYYLFTAFNWKITTLFVVQALAMIELGTKVAALGLIGGILVSLLVFSIHSFLFKNTQGNYKALIASLLIAMGAIAIIPFGPVVQRYNYEAALAKQSDHNLTKENKILTQGLKKYPTGIKRKTFLKKFIAQNYHAYALNKKFVFKSYPYQYDPEFWLKVMKQPGQVRMQNRYLEESMLEQVQRKNNNQLDKYLGISYTRETNIFNLERDFASQVYSLGWLGMLLFIGPYVVILLYSIICWLKYKQVRTYLISSMILAISFMLAAAFSSGNVMDFLTASFILAFIQGNLLVQIKIQKTSPLLR